MIAASTCQSHQPFQLALSWWPCPGAGDCLWGDLCSKPLGTQRTCALGCNSLLFELTGNAMTDVEYLADENSAHFLPNHCCSRTRLIVTHVVPLVFHLSSPKRPEENAVGSRGAINYWSRKRDMQPKSICCKSTYFTCPYYFCIIVIILIVFSKSRREHFIKGKLITCRCSKGASRANFLRWTN